MIPLFLGEREQQLFGVIDPAVPPRKRRAVLVLQPGGWEYLRAHRTLRLLAKRMADAGIDAMRFDYRSTGDSWGGLSYARPSLDDWLEDAEIALDELMAVASVGKVSLVGLRLGARLAQLLADRLPESVDRLILWDPVGLTEAEASQGHPHGSTPVDGPSMEVPGEVAKAVASRLAERWAPSRSRPATWCVTTGDYALPDDLVAAGCVAEVFAEAPRCWVEDRYRGAGAVPLAIVDRIVEILAS